MLMIVLDATIVNVALPSIQDDLGFSQSNLAWVVNAYLIAFGGLLLLAGRIGDLIGQRRDLPDRPRDLHARVALCAVAQTQGMLIGARFVQGVGGAVASAVILGMIVTMFPRAARAGEGDRRLQLRRLRRRLDRPAAGGVLTEAINWHWIFFVNIPVGIAIALLARRLVEDRPGHRPQEGADLPGAVLLTGGLMLGVYTILEAGRAGLGLDPDARARRRLDRAAGRLRRAPGAHREPADAAAPVPLAQRRRARTPSWPCWWSGSSRCSSWARCTCRRSSTTTPLEVGLAFLPRASSWGRCRWVTPSG